MTERPEPVPDRACVCSARLVLGGTPAWMAPAVLALFDDVHTGEGHGPVEVPAPGVDDA